MKSVLQITVCAVCLITLCAGFEMYDGYKIVRVVPETQQQLDILVSLYKGRTDLELDFWLPPTKVGRSVDIMFHGKNEGVLSTLLTSNKMNWKTAIQNVKTLMEVQKAAVDNVPRFLAGHDPKDFDIDQYHSQQDINNWMDSLAASYPSIASTFSIGKSHQGRDMKVIKIGAAGTNKKGFWLDACIHAREWIACSTTNYIINELVTKYSTNATYKQLVDNIDFYILPVMNPDGYEYSRSTDRNWRKTRSGPYKGTGGRSCYGVDPNRNYDFHWGESGVSQNACQDDYDGPTAFSEIECVQQANWQNANKNKIQTYMSLHSYADLWMYPYAYAANTYPPNKDTLDLLGQQSVAALKSVQGTVYQVGSPADILYAAAGGSFDYATGVSGIAISYTLELRPGDGDTVNDQAFGFDLPPSYINPVGQETWAGIMVTAKNLLN